MNAINFHNIPLPQLILLGLLAFAILVQVIYYLSIYLRPALWKQKTKTEKQAPVSVIICARNEAENLRQNLPQILSQSYSEYEVVVVNDCSEDHSEMVLGELESKYKNLRHTTIEIDRAFSHGKKLAINIGIKSAKYEHLVFIDADCYPSSANWLKHMAESYTTNKQLVLGYGAYKQAPGFLNKLIRFDTFFIGMQYLGFAIAGLPYMGVGRNLSYLKSLYKGGSGFKKHYQLVSGDDDLFVNEHARKSNTAVMPLADATTISTPSSSFGEWAKQKKRHLTTAPYYRFIHKFLLGAEIGTRFAFYLAIILLAVAGFNPYIILASYLFRLLIQLVIIKLVMNKLNEKGFLLLTPIFDIILPLLQLFFIFSNRLNAKYSKWI